MSKSSSIRSAASIELRLSIASRGKNGDQRRLISSHVIREELKYTCAFTMSSKVMFVAGSAEQDRHGHGAVRRRIQELELDGSACRHSLGFRRLYRQTRPQRSSDRLPPPSVCWRRATRGRRSYVALASTFLVFARSVSSFRDDVFPTRRLGGINYDPVTVPVCACRKLVFVSADETAGQIGLVLTRRLPFICRTLYYKEIKLSAKVMVIYSGTSSQTLNLENFATVLQSSQRIVNLL